MGGHRGGQRASELAVDVVNNAFRDGRFDAEPHPDLPSAASELARAVQMSNAAILAESSRRPELSGMGTTLCAVRFSLDNRRLYVGHVGDSRCYRLRDGVMRQLTTDHTMADHGVRGPEGAQLSRALGMFPTVPIDVILAAPRLGDVYLLCSDGLTKMLADETIATQLQHEEDPRAAVSRLIMFANAHGGKDNISIVLLRVVELGWKPPAS
jgi:protein phosphatase